jgi:hypothetical protein
MVSHQLLWRAPGQALINPKGRAIGVVSRQHAKEGYMDLDLDDFRSGSLYADWQQIVLDTAEILVVSFKHRSELAKY